MSVKVSEVEAHRFLSQLADEGWQAAARGLEILSRIGDFSFNSASIGASEAAGLYRSRMMTITESGKVVIEVAEFVDSLSVADATEVFVFSVADAGWACVCAVDSDTERPIGAVAMEL
ncbi:hypothetical protein ACIQF6_04855 [Kitasatospora sp. NPDC092948]|uniref:hypothetical protein n=1 Tax=Kitasatospora sp. NPDC092948 TaxID=3364088 RepID=UPI00381D67FF